MPRVRFLGFVHPMKVIKVLVTTSEITWKSPDIGLDATFTVQIRDFAVQVDCETNRAGPGDFIHLYFRAFDLKFSLCRFNFVRHGHRPNRRSRNVDRRTRRRVADGTARSRPEGCMYGLYAGRPSFV